MYVVLNTDQSIRDGDVLTLVGISSKFEDDDESAVPLDWSNPGTHSATGLTKRSAAITSWPETATQDDVEITEGFVKPRFLKAILLKRDES